MPQIAKKLESKPLSWFRVVANVRKFFNQKELRELEESLRMEGQIQPLGAYQDGALYWGQRRLMAAPGAGLTHLDTYVFKEPLTDTQIRIYQLTENLQRQDITGFEKWTAAAELMCMNPHWQQKDLGVHLHLSESMTCIILSPSRCIPAAQEALAAGKLALTDCYALSKCETPEHQAELLALKLQPGAKVSRAELERQRRKQQRNGIALAVKVNRIKIQLASGVTAMFSGKELSLDEAIEAASEAHKMMKKGQDQGLTAKTIQKVSADRAKA